MITAHNTRLNGSCQKFLGLPQFCGLSSPVDVIKMSAFEASGPINIASQDILDEKARGKYSDENMLQMRTFFPGCQDEELARYLIARNNDLGKAKELLAKAKAWKKRNLPVLKIACGAEFGTGKMYSHGFDKEGRPLLIWTSKLNVAARRNLKETGRLAVWWTEYTCRQLPPNMSKYTILMDRTGAGRENSDMELVKFLVNVLQDGYPERVKRIIIYPTDWVFWAIWNIGKWLLDPVTRDKVQPMLQLVGVEQFIDMKHIPKNMGGESPFSYNMDDFSDFWSPEEIANAPKPPASDAEDTFGDTSIGGPTDADIPAEEGA